MKKITFDESGNTGANLLDKDQPVFVLASVEDVKEIRNIVPENNQELKFSRMRRSAKGRQHILKILNHEELTTDRIILSGFHKRFMIITKIVDLLYEPLAYINGVDLYERGANIALSNLLYYNLPLCIGQDLFEQILNIFVDLVRNYNNGSLDKFYSIINEAYSVTDEECLKPELGTLLNTRSIAEKHGAQFYSNSLDPAIPGFVNHASKWTGLFQEPFEIIHDASKPLENEQLILEAMMSITEESELMGYDRRKMNFPISATGINFVDSTNVKSVQIVDIIASSAGYVLKMSLKEKNSTFVSELLETNVLSSQMLPVWPMPKVTPEELGTNQSSPKKDINEYVGKYIKKRLGNIPPIGKRKNMDNN